MDGGGTARLLLWGDPKYLKRFVETVRTYAGNSFEVNEPLATKGLGDAHNAPERPILSAKTRYFEYEIERYWRFFALFGRVSYDPRTPEDFLDGEIERRMGPAGREAIGAQNQASRVLPRIVAASYLYRNFPTTRGWAEMQPQGDLTAYTAMAPTDTEQFQSVHERALAILHGTETAARTPEATSRWFAGTADSIDRHVAAARRMAGPNPGKELVSTLADAEILAGLARFHSFRLLAGVDYCLFRETGDRASVDRAISNERKAIAAWEGIVKAAGDTYRDDLAFGVERVGFPRHWKDELGKLRDGLAVVESQRAASKMAQIPERKGLGDGPKVELLAPGIARAGKPIEIAVKPRDPAAIRTIRLRYRHMKQYEDYETAAMTAGADGIYRASIPGAFVTAQWDLVYFVEAIDKAGNGAIAPDLEVETPYRVVSVAR